MATQASTYTGSTLIGAFNSTFCNVDFNPVKSRADIAATVSHVPAGPISVYKYDGSGLRRATRSSTHIRCNPIDDLILITPLKFAQEIRQSGNGGVVVPGNFVLASTNAPFESLCGTPPYHRTSELVIKMPGALVRRKLPLIDRCCGTPFTAERGIGRILNSLIQAVIAERCHLSGAQFDALGVMLLDTVCLAVNESPMLLSLHGSTSRDPNARVLLKAQAFIESHLPDPELGARMIADHCGVSRGHLHAVFAASSMKLGAFIRENRLLSCREELRNAAMRNVSVTQIALRWGYDNPASFARAYRARFGVAPSADRSPARADPN